MNLRIGLLFLCVFGTVQPSSNASKRTRKTILTAMVCGVYIGAALKGGRGYSNPRKFLGKWGYLSKMFYKKR